MLFNFPQNGEVTVTTHHHPHTFVDLITHADVMETTGTFGAIQQQTDAGGRSQVAFYHFRLKSAVEAYFDLEEPGVFLNYVVTGRIDAHHDQLGDMWQQHHTCSLSYLPTGKHCYRIQKGNCISVKVKISLPLIEMLSKSYPDLHTFYKRASTLSPDGWRLPYVPTGSKTTKLLRQLASLGQIGAPREVLVDSQVDKLMLQFIDDLAKTKKSKKDTYQYNPTEVAAILESRDEILSRRYLGVPIPSMALDFNMPYRKFNRYYKKATNSNVRDDKKRDRVKAACKLLTTTDLSVGAIADELEYKSHASFTRTFCEVMGCTPTRYRQYHRRGGDA